MTTTFECRIVPRGDRAHVEWRGGHIDGMDDAQLANIIGQMKRDSFVGYKQLKQATEWCLATFSAELDLLFRFKCDLRLSISLYDGEVEYFLSDYLTDQYYCKTTMVYEFPRYVFPMWGRVMLGFTFRFIVSIAGLDGRYVSRAAARQFAEWCFRCGDLFTFGESWPPGDYENVFSRYDIDVETKR